MIYNADALGDDFLVGMTWQSGTVTDIIVSDTNGLVLGEYDPAEFANLIAAPDFA